MKCLLQFSCKNKKQAQSGQALTEFIVIALALIPMFLLMPMLGKYQDMTHSTQMASRYVAMEAMKHNGGLSNWKSEVQLAGEIRRRFFSNSDAAIKTGDTAGNFAENQNMLWRDPQGNPLIKDFNADVSVSFGASKAATHAGGFTAASDGKPFSLPLYGHDELGLPARGVYTANVTVVIANLPSFANSFTKSYDEFKNIGLTITRHTSVVVDPWTAKNPGQVISAIDNIAMFPGKLLAPTKPLVGAAVAIMESPKYFPSICLDCGPKLGDLDFWTDVVPADRLR